MDRAAVELGVGSSATRATPMTGVSQRSSSSMAAGMIDGIVDELAALVGCWAR